MDEGKTVNVGIFGDKDVGKTAFVGRFIDKKFQNTTTSTFLNMPIGSADVYGNTVKFSIYDVPGSPEYQSLAAGVYAGIEVAILCFDVTNQDSFDGLSAWVSRINGGLPAKGVKVLVGLKGDMTRRVQSETARSFATQNGYMYFEASAKSGQKDVNEVFCVSAAKALGIPLPPPPEPKPKGSSCCCFM
ncbi:Ras-related protein RABF2b [Taenia crassiceps]|uniref:Ras-related protein RABF2b n=1 Tax=Taenia crassiceps TaxID=6207 RepID=A0ABR4QL79_9CEST